MTTRTIWLNEDNHHFYGCHPPEDMTVEGCQRLVDFYAEDTQVAAILFCANVQRALFDSQVWERFWDGYDPALGDDQPALKRGHGVKNHLLLQERGVDHLAVWLERCRHHGIQGWLTMRMNDCHGLKEVVQQEAGVEDHSDSWTTHWATDFWRKRPDLRRAPYRLERSWEGAFDYGKQEVRDHHMALIRELLGRFDMDGLELDWMRWGMHFAPGQEAAGRIILNDFIREVRRLADEAEQRLGHPVRLAHRIPADPRSALALGYDPVTWVREGLADVITLAAFCGGCDFNIPFDIWRPMLGDAVRLLAHLDEVASPYPKDSIREYELLYGAAATALNRQADGIYLFNQIYRESDDPELLAHMLRHLGDEDTLAGCTRRHAVTYPQATAPGAPRAAFLPIPLKQPKIGTDFARMEDTITLRIDVGKVPPNTDAALVLGFQGTSDLASLPVRLNTHEVQPTDAPTYSSLHAKTPSYHGWQADFIDQAQFYALPAEDLNDGENTIEILPPPVNGHLVWAEIVMTPEA